MSCFQGTFKADQFAQQGIPLSWERASAMNQPAGL
jgi:hypothetical protein